MARHAVSPELLKKLDQLFPDRVTMTGILPESTPAEVIAKVNQRIGARKVIDYLRSLGEDDQDEGDE